MKGIRRAIRSVFAKKEKIAKSTREVTPSNPSRGRHTHSTPEIRIAASTSKNYINPLVISTTTPDRRSNADTFCTSSVRPTDYSPVLTISSRTSVADFCEPQSPVPNTTDRRARSEFDIFEEKCASDDAAAQWHSIEDNLISAPTDRIVSRSSSPASASELGTSSIDSMFTFEYPASAAQPKHPAFLSDAEFALLPHYEDIEDDSTYDAYYTRPDDSFASIASLSSYIAPSRVDETWVRQVRTGFDVGGELHFFNQGAKRKDACGAMDPVGMVQVSNGVPTKVSDCNRKKRDCRVREKQIRVEFGVPLSTDEEDMEWEEAYEDGYVFGSDSEVNSSTIKASEDNDSAVLMGILDYLGIGSQGADEPRHMDDGYGGYGREIF